MLMKEIPSVSSVLSVVHPRMGAAPRHVVAGTAGPGTLGELTMKGVKAMKNDLEPRRTQRTRRILMKEIPSVSSGAPAPPTKPMN